MDEYERPRKQIEGRARPPAPRFIRVDEAFARGKLKGKPVTDDASAGSKRLRWLWLDDRRRRPNGRRTAGGTFPCQWSTRSEHVRAEDRSFRLSLRVEGDRITVVNAIEVDAPARQAIASAEPISSRFGSAATS